MADSGKRNASVALILVGVVAGMVGLSFAAVPLYRLFCQVTGFGGTTQVADVAPEEVLERAITVRFNADVARAMPWRFRPPERPVELKVGEVGLASFTAMNPSAQTVTGRATFNVTPLKAGLYFNKVACFCFDELVLGPGESAELPVTFFVDPEIAEDRNLDDVRTITLSYTFFRTDEGEGEDEVRLSGRRGGAAPGPNVN